MEAVRETKTSSGAHEESINSNMLVLSFFWFVLNQPERKNVIKTQKFHLQHNDCLKSAESESEPHRAADEFIEVSIAQTDVGRPRVGES